MSFRLTSPTVELSENDVIKDCFEILARRLWWPHRNPVGHFRTMSDTPVEFGPRGIPDYTVIHAVYPAFLLEFKRPGKTLRPTQVDRFAEIQFGYRLAAVMVATVAELADFLRGHEQRARIAMQSEIP